MNLWQSLLCRIKTPIPLFGIGFKFKGHKGCVEVVDHIIIDKEYVSYRGYTEEGWSQGSRWALDEEKVLKYVIS